MDYSRITYTLFNDLNREGRSALPDAPVVLAARAETTHKRLYALRGRLASGLHRTAWAIEPAPPALTVNSYRSTRHCEGACS